MKVKLKAREAIDFDDGDKQEDMMVLDVQSSGAAKNGGDRGQ
jgi:hypothetical protein